MSSLRISALGLAALFGTSIASSSALISAFTKPASAEVRRLGATRLSLVANETDVIRVQSCNPLIDRIQMRVQGTDVNIKRLVLRFRNGQVDEVDIRSNFKQGESTRWIELPGSQRCVDRIAVIGSSELGSSFRPALIEFFGDTRTVTNTPPLASPNSRVLGEVRLAYSTRDMDVIRVESCNPRIERLQLRAKNADANIKFLALRFKNGRVEELDVRSFLPRGSATRWIDLPGGARCIDRIGIIGTSSLGSNFNPARIEFVGQYSDKPSGPNAAQPRLLGATKLSIFDNSPDYVRVAECKPRVSSIQLRARNSDAYINRVVVTFGNGERQTLNMRNTLRKDQETRWMPLDGKMGRCVTQIRVLGDNKLDWQFRSSRVEFWGR
jgi:hypothetical protein